MAFQGLREEYTDGKQVIKMLNGRYGLNIRAVKSLMGIDTKRYHKLNKKGEQLTEEEKKVLIELFEELEGRI